MHVTTVIDEHLNAYSRACIIKIVSVMTILISTSVSYTSTVLPRIVAHAPISEKQPFLPHSEKIIISHVCDIVDIHAPINETSRCFIYRRIRHYAEYICGAIVAER